MIFAPFANAAIMTSALVKASMTIVLVIAWLAWHRIQFKGESLEFEEMVKGHNKEDGKKSD